MGRTGIIITGLLAIVLVIGGIITFGNKKDNNTNQAATTNTSAPASNSTDTTNTTTQPAAATAVISYNGNLFSPSQVTIKKGDTVSVKNDSSVEVDFESDPHPTHTSEPELNAGIIMPGQSQSFTVTRVGSWGYHNHLNQTQTGTIVVR